MRKKIMIDARVVTSDCHHGIARYCFSLLQELAKNQASSCYNFLVLVAKDSPLPNLGFPPHFQFYNLKTHWQSIWGQFELPLFIFRLKPDLFHAPSFIVPLFSRVPLAVTLHDLNHVTLAHNYSSKQKIYYRFFLKKRLKKSDAVITISRFSRQEILSFLGPQNHPPVWVIYNGVSSAFQQAAACDEGQKNRVREKYGLPDRFLLSVGNSKPHKNLARLITAYRMGRFHMPLVVLCPQPFLLRDPDNRVLFLERVAEDDLPVLYGLSFALVFPSLYEGFGLPPLEAAACGVPTLVHNGASLPEVMGNAAFYMNANDPEQITEALCQLLSREPAALDAKGREGVNRARLFSWQYTAAETLNVYHSFFKKNDF